MRLPEKFTRRAKAPAKSGWTYVLVLIVLATAFDASVAYFCIKSERRSQSELVQTAAAKQALDSLQDALLQVNSAVSSGIAAPVVIGEHALELQRYANARRALDELSALEPATRAVTKDGLSLRDLTEQYLESARQTLDRWRGKETLTSGGTAGLMPLNVRLNAVLAQIAVERNIESERVTRAMNSVFGWSYWVVPWLKSVSIVLSCPARDP